MITHIEQSLYCHFILVTDTIIIPTLHIRKTQHTQGVTKNVYTL